MEEVKIKYSKIIPCYLFGYDPYFSLSAEQEAYDYQKDIEYIKVRKRFNWLKGIFKFRKNGT